MLILPFVVRMFPLGLMVLGAGVVSGQDYPNKPIRIVTDGAKSSRMLVSKSIN